MARTVNLLDDNDALLRYSRTSGNTITIAQLDHNWLATNATLEVVSTDFVVDTRYTITLYPSSASMVALELADVPLKLADNSRVLSANLRIKCNSPISTATYLYIDGDDSSTEPYVQTFTSGQYSAVHSNRTVVPDDTSNHTATIRVEITGHQAGNIFVTLPHLIHDLAFYENPFPGRMRNFLPDFYFEIDSAQEAPTYPFFKLIDVLTAAAGETAIEHDRMYGLEMGEVLDPSLTTEFWTKSTLVNPRAVRDAYVPWLSQFTCSSLRQNFRLQDGSLYLDNPSLQRDFIEWQLLGSHYGRAAGTREAMIEAAKRVLIKTKDGEQSTLSISLTPRYLDDPFAILIQTLTNETIDADAGESSALVLESVGWAKPMGYEISHITVDEFLFTLDDITLGVLDEFRFG